MTIYSPETPKANLNDLLRAVITIRKKPELLILLALYVYGILNVTNLKQLLMAHNLTIKRVFIPALIAKGYVSELIEVKPRFFCNRTNNVKVTLYQITPAGEAYLKTALKLP